MWKQGCKVKRKASYAKFYFTQRKASYAKFYFTQRRMCKFTISESFPSDKPTHLQILLYHLQTFFKFISEA